MIAFEDSPLDVLERALADLRRGGVLAINHRDSTYIVASAETVSADRFDAFTETPGAVLALTARRAEVLRLRVYDSGLARIPLPSERRLVQALTDPSRDLDWPMKGPFEPVRDEPPEIEPLALRLCKQARLLPAAICAKVPTSGLKSSPSEMLEAALDGQSLFLTRFSNAQVPLALAESARVFGFRPSDGGPDHFAIVVGGPSTKDAVLVRAHSECYTGDQLGSLKCDCGPQLRAALAQMSAEGAGILLYLAQEGRGIGMANKLRAYALQDQGFDTVEANHRLGFEDDERDFRVAALMLKDLGFTRVRVLTNNPRKTAAFKQHGIAVDNRVPLAVGRTAENTDYLDTKASKSGHLL